MVTIIERGTKHIRKCGHCGCLFSYEDEDIYVRYEWLVPIEKTIKCPQCGSDIFLESLKSLNDEED